MGSINILQASAGSGKTFTLAYQYIKSVVQEPYNYNKILAVTFTNKATEEMKQRIIKELHLLSSGKDSKYLSMLHKDLGYNTAKIRENSKQAQSLILHDYSRFSVLTIDKFFQRIIRSFIKELGMDLNFNIELKTQGILDNAVDTLIDNISQDDNLRSWIIDFLNEKIDASSKWDIKTTLVELGEEIFKDNFMGSTLDKNQIQKLVNSVGKKASLAQQEIINSAQKITSLAQSNNLDLDDFAYGNSGVYGYVLKLEKGIVEKPSARAEKIIEGNANWFSKGKINSNKVKEIQDQLTDYLKDAVDTLEENYEHIISYKLLKQNYRSFALLNELSHYIRKIYSEQNILHITETNKMLSSLISNNDAPFIFEKVGNTFSEYMIDEFQDTSLKQWQNFIPLLHNTLSQTTNNPVLLVGDVKQSIYRWRGGDWTILGSKAQHEFANSTVDTLKVNYRSLNNIVEFNNNMIEAITTSDNTMLNEMLEGKLPEYKDMLKEAYANHAQKPNNKENEGYINITFTEKDEPDAKPLIINRIEQLQERGYRPGDIAILVRTNRQTKELASILLKYKGEHPESKYCYDVVTSEALSIGRSRDVNFIISILRFSTDKNNLIFRAVINNYLNKDFDNELDEHTNQLILYLQNSSPLEAFEAIINHYNLGENSIELAYIQALHSQIISYCSSNIADTVEFLNWWDKTGCEQSINIPQSRKAITIISIHKSKGLEFKNVIIPFCNWSLSPKTGSVTWCESQELDDLGKFPVGWAKEIKDSYFSDEYIKEEVLAHIDNINTYYVAATRAEQELHIIIPTKEAKGKIDTLIRGALNHSDKEAYIGNMKGKYSKTDNAEIFEFGQEVYPHVEAETPSKTIKSYYSRKIDVKENLRQKTQRYYDKDQNSKIASPRDYGILMHRIFENSSSLEQVIQACEHMNKDAIINQDELNHLKSLIEQALENPTIASWFTNSWDEVKNEKEIILPNNTKIKRPDRVMIKGDRAVVVDYKFGLNKSKSHVRQILEYGQILEQMGYKKVECYLWYVTTNELTIVP